MYFGLGLIPAYLLVRFLGLVGTFWAYIVPSHIVFPMCLPVVAALSSFTFVGHWNAYFDTLLYNFAHRRLFTLQYYLYVMLTSKSAQTLMEANEMGMRQQASPALYPY